MKEIFKPNTNEQPAFIVLGILTLYILVSGFVFYLYFLHRISIIIALFTVLIFTLLYFPRLLIIKKLYKKDLIKILDNSILINNIKINFSEIKSFNVENKKPKVVFFINNNMVVFQEAKFTLSTTNGQIEFIAIGTEKIRLLTEFLENVRKNW
ncbi:hypothetical protein IJ541_04975 [bacterium]|nr:hypothetical protein [bacterium]